MRGRPVPRRCNSPVITPWTVAFLEVSILFATHEAYLDHLVGPSHPERPERLGAVIDGARSADVAQALVPLVPRAARIEQVLRVHTPEHVERLQRVVDDGGGRLDEDTVASAHSMTAALLAAGAGLTAIEELFAGNGDVAFCAVRPPGHHATRDQAMGFCLLSNVAIVAAELVERGERVLIVDFDAHHGNGTQDIFYGDDRVLFVSLHQWPLYPGSGWFDEIGEGRGFGHTLNIPLPIDSCGDDYLEAFDELILPLAESFRPSWLVVSAGFDAHRNDPITRMGLVAGDYSRMLHRILPLVPKGRVIMMLEGGYDLEALRECTASSLSAVARTAVHDNDTVSRTSSSDAGRARITEIRNFLVSSGVSAQ